MKQAHLNVLAEESGFVIHLDNGWLGSSPDGLVKGVEATDGMLEVKCSYSKHNLTPGEACSDKNFYCELHNSEIRLKQTHTYFHQVQLQLYVGADLYGWCDFYVYTCKGMSIERIYPDVKWQVNVFHNLNHFMMTTCYLKLFHTNTNLDIIFEINFLMISLAVSLIDACIILDSLLFSVFNKKLRIMNIHEYKTYLHKEGKKLVRLAHIKKN